MMERLKRKGFFQLEKDDARTLVLTLLMGFIMGAFWIGLIAAWEHYDEPNHFQYIRMLIDQGRLPEPGEENYRLNRQILKSMIWNGFFTRLGSEPPLPPPRQPLYLPGYSQYSEPPFYYYLASAGVAIMRSQNITRQMFAARVVSLLLFLITVLAGWGIARELTRPGNPIRWMLPVSLVFLPGLLDVMTAVNNDSAAIAITSLFFWSAVRMVKNGFGLFEFFWSLILAVLGLFTKSTAVIGLLIFPLVVVLSILRGKWKWLVWITITVLILVALPFLFNKEDAAFFYRSTSMQDPLRIEHPDAVSGKWVLQLDVSMPNTPVWMTSIFQPVPAEITRLMLGRPVTLGVWMWADRELIAQTPRLVTKQAQYYQSVELTEEPAFFTVHGYIELENSRLWVSIDQPENLGVGKVYYDGFILAEGNLPSEYPPTLIDEDGGTGMWGGKPFTNLIRNGSIETPGFMFFPPVDQMLANFLPDNIRPSFVLTSIIDQDGAGFYYSNALRHIFFTFWGYFGWSHIPISFSFVYTLAIVITALGVIGSFIAMVRRWKTVPWHLVILFILAIVTVGVSAIVRGVIYLSFGDMFFPVARYLMTVILPIMLVFVVGWNEFAGMGKKFVNRISRKGPGSQDGKVSWKAFGIFSGAWLVFDLFAIFSILAYYHGFPVLF